MAAKQDRQQIAQTYRNLPGASIPADEIWTTYTPAYTSSKGDEEDSSIQCPIPLKDRVFNHTGSQCVHASVECLGRWAEEPKITNPPYTSRPECKSYSSPTNEARILTDINVKFEQTYKDKNKGVQLIKKAMTEGRGCLFGVPGHAMVICHYDDDKNMMKWIDNSDRTLKIQTQTIDRFNSRWDSWILVIYPDDDSALQRKLNRFSLPRKIPIRDRNNSQREYPKDYIPLPQQLFFSLTPGLMN